MPAEPAGRLRRRSRRRRGVGDVARTARASRCRGTARSRSRPDRAALGQQPGGGRADAAGAAGDEGGQVRRSRSCRTPCSSGSTWIFGPGPAPGWPLVRTAPRRRRRGRRSRRPAAAGRPRRRRTARWSPARPGDATEHADRGDVLQREGAGVEQARRLGEPDEDDPAPGSTSSSGRAGRCGGVGGVDDGVAAAGRGRSSAVQASVEAEAAGELQRRPGRPSEVDLGAAGAGELATSRPIVPGPRTSSPLAGLDAAPRGPPAARCRRARPSPRRRRRRSRAGRAGR